MNKINRVDGDLFACQGIDHDVVLFEEWYRSGKNREECPELDEDSFAALVLTSEGRIFRYFNKCVASEVNADFSAMGTGDQVAIGAMAAGASPEEAIEIACRYNAFSGPPVCVESLDNG